jgi:hypothetical protein
MFVHGMALWPTRDPQALSRPFENANFLAASTAFGLHCQEPIMSISALLTAKKGRVPLRSATTLPDYRKRRPTAFPHSSYLNLRLGCMKRSRMDGKLHKRIGATLGESNIKMRWRVMGEAKQPAESLGLCLQVQSRKSISANPISSFALHSRSHELSRTVDTSQLQSVHHITYFTNKPVRAVRTNELSIKATKILDSFQQHAYSYKEHLPYRHT